MVCVLWYIYSVLDQIQQPVPVPIVYRVPVPGPEPIPVPIDRYGIYSIYGITDTYVSDGRTDGSTVYKYQAPQHHR